MSELKKEISGVVSLYVHPAPEWLVDMIEVVAVSYATGVLTTVAASLEKMPKPDSPFWFRAGYSDAASEIRDLAKAIADRKVS